MSSALIQSSYQRRELFFAKIATIYRLENQGPRDTIRVRWLDTAIRLASISDL
jgi:hypothetical protein